MPCNDEHDRPAMEHLAAPVRVKAIEIANALLAEGHDEGFAIRAGIARARPWAWRHGIDEPAGISRDF